MKPTIKKKITHYRPQIRSRHPSHAILRTALPLLNFRSIVRFGSETELPDTITEGGSRVECNTVESIENTANKVKMKELFASNKIKSPEFITSKSNSEIITWAEDKYPIIIKINSHSRGRGMSKIDNKKELSDWLSKNNASGHIFEKYYNYAREYRLHMSQFGCFYPFRKLRKSDAKERWFFNSTNCVFILEENQLFDRPRCWKEIISECKKALSALKLDIGGFDVRVNQDGSNFMIIEANSACSFGDLTAKKYISEITKVLQDKHMKLIK